MGLRLIFSSSEIVAIKKMIVKMKEVNWVKDFENGWLPL